jgi:hypothetical protein
MTDLRGRPAKLAVQLRRYGARFVVVGSTARWLVTGEGSPRDLDVVVEARDLPRFTAALEGLGAGGSHALAPESSQLHVDTSWGPLDVFVGLPRSRPVAVEWSGASLLLTMAMAE